MMCCEDVHTIRLHRIKIIFYDPSTYFTFNNFSAEPVTKLMNESWRELILDANIGKPVIEAALTQLVSIVNKLFQAVPAEELEIV